MSYIPSLSRTAVCGAVIGLAVAATAIAQPAAASPAEREFLQTFVGEWRGQGSFRRSPRHQPESVICRANASLNGANQLEIGGRCGGEGFTGTFRVTAQYDPSTGGYSALFAGPPSIGSSQLTGHRRDGDLQLSVNHPGQPPSTLLISQQSQAAFRIRSQTVLGQETFTSAEIQLRRE